VIAEGLSELMESRARADPGLADAVKRLRDAVGLEERHCPITTGGVGGIRAPAIERPAAD
jgi:hypothetical protein